MALNLTDRIVRLFKADAHAIVESLEERSLLLKQYVREAEIALNRKRAGLDALRDEEKQLRDALLRREEEIRRLDQDIERALAASKDELARFAVRRLLPRRHEVQALHARIAECGVEIAALAEQVEAQQAQFESLRARVRAELARQAQDGPGPAVCLGDAVVADEDVELELLRRRVTPHEHQP